MIDLERQKENFKNHVATFTDYGNIKILDFKNPNSNDYRIRFLFEEDYCRLHISGDLGHLIASNYSNMRYETFLSHYANNVSYFASKIDCADRPLHYYDVDVARKEITEELEELGYEPTSMFDEPLEQEVEDLLEYYDSQNGFDARVYDKLSDLELSWDYFSDAGKQPTGILDLYMLAFRLATEQLGKGENKE